MLTKQLPITASGLGSNLLPTKDWRQDPEELHVMLSNRRTPSLFSNPGFYFHFQLHQFKGSKSRMCELAKKVRGVVLTDSVCESSHNSKLADSRKLFCLSAGVRIYPWGSDFLGFLRTLAHS